MYYNREMTDKSPSQYFNVTSKNRQSSSSQLISVRLPVELLERLAAVGNTQGLAMSDTIRLVLERGLANQKKGK
jgi:predicted DNA binding CopG/RHH family protein